MPCVLSGKSIKFVRKKSWIISDNFLLNNTSFFAVWQKFTKAHHAAQFFDRGVVAFKKLEGSFSCAKNWGAHLGPKIWGPPLATTFLFDVAKAVLSKIIIMLKGHLKYGKTAQACSLSMLPGICIIFSLLTFFLYLSNSTCKNHLVIFQRYGLNSCNF